MFFSILQYGLFSLAALAAVLLFGLVATFRLWKKSIIISNKESLGYRYKSKAHEKRYDTAAQWFDKYLNPVVLIWIGSVALGVWVIIRVVVSFIQ